MIYVTPLTEAETNSLQEIVRTDFSAWTRVRATSVLLSAQKIPLQSIASVSGVCRQTVSIWLHNWKEQGVNGLTDKPRPGRPPELSVTQATETIVMGGASGPSLCQR